jgi:hypothetical protein
MGEVGLSNEESAAMLVLYKESKHGCTFPDMVR